MAKTPCTEKSINVCPQTEEQIKKRLSINELNRTEEAKEANQRWRTLYINWVLRTGRTKKFDSFT